MAVQPVVVKLKSKLATSKAKENDYPLYDVIRQLIDYINQSQIANSESFSQISSDVIASINTQIALLKSLDYLTHSDESATLTNSRELLAGTNVTFDDTVAGERTVNVSITEREWSVLTDGNLAAPQLIFASGDVIMTHVP